MTIKESFMKGGMNIALVFLVSLALVPFVCAGTGGEQPSDLNFSAQGADWSLIANGTPVIDPVTGQQYSSFGAVMRTIPNLWESFTPGEQEIMNESPAVVGRIAMRFNQTSVETLRIIPLEGIPMSDAEYYQRVWPDLYAAAPMWVKSTWIWQQKSWGGFNGPPGTSPISAFVHPAGENLPVSPVDEGLTGITGNNDLRSLLYQIPKSEGTSLLTDPSLIVNVEKAPLPAVRMTCSTISFSSVVSPWIDRDELLPMTINPGGPMKPVQIVSSSPLLQEYDGSDIPLPGSAIEYTGRGPAGELIRNFGIGKTVSSVGY